jgi:hypothetical protein
MRHPSKVRGAARRRIRPETGAGPESRAAFWRINGCRARLLIWTPDEWQKMKLPPADAQFHPCGVWCALRLD